MGSARLRLSNDYQGGWRPGSVLGYAKHEGQMDTLSRGCNSKDLLFFKASDSNSGRTDQHFVQSKAGDFPLYFSALMLPRPELLSPNHFPAPTQGPHCPRAGYYNSFKTVTYFIAGLILQYVRMKAMFRA